MMAGNSAMQISSCSVDEVFDHPAFPQLCAEAAAEVADPELSAVAPDRQQYRMLEAGGSAQCFRCGAGEELYGFAFVLFAPSGHNGRRYATVESLFVASDRRSGGAGDRLLETIHAASLEAGCEDTFYSAHVGSQMARLMLLQSKRYKLACLIFRRCES